MNRPTTKPLVWITGGGGLIGSCLARTAQVHAPEWRIAALTRDQLDLTDHRSVRQQFENDRPALIIHCAAMSKSPDCQADPARARQVNVDATGCITALSADIPLVFFSTDLVFDGQKGNYNESDRTNPLSVYGETKVEAERLVAANPKHIIIRTSLNGGQSPTGDRGFNEQLRRDWAAGRPLKLFTDEYRNPIPALLTAQAVWELVRQKASGLFHLGGSERLSRCQIAELVARRCPELHPKIEPTSRLEYQGPPRPRDTSLNCDKIQRLLPFRLPGLSQWLEDHPVEYF